MLDPIHLRDPEQDTSLLYLCVDGDRIFESVEVLATAIYEKAGYKGPSSLGGIIPRALVFDDPKTTAIPKRCRGPILEFVRERMMVLLPEAAGPVEDLIALRLTRAGEIDVLKRLIAMNEPLLKARTAVSADSNSYDQSNTEPRDVTAEFDLSVEQIEANSNSPQSHHGSKGDDNDQTIEPGKATSVAGLADRTNIKPEAVEDERSLVGWLLTDYRFWVTAIAMVVAGVLGYLHWSYTQNLANMDEGKPVIVLRLLPGKTDFEESFNREIQSYIDKKVMSDTCPYRVSFEEKQPQITLLDDAIKAEADAKAKGIVWFECSPLGEEKKIRCSKFDVLGYYASESWIVKAGESDHSVTDFFEIAALSYLVEAAASSFEARSRISEAYAVLHEGIGSERGLIQYPEFVEQMGRLVLKLHDYTTAADFLLSAKDQLDKSPPKLKDHMRYERELIIREAAEALVRSKRLEDAFALLSAANDLNSKTPDISTGDGFLYSRQGLALVKLQFPPGIVALIMPKKDTLLVSEIENPPANLFDQIAPKEFAYVVKGSPLDHLLCLTKAPVGQGVFRIDWTSAIHAGAQPGMEYKKVRNILPLHGLKK